MGKLLMVCGNFFFGFLVFLVVILIILMFVNVKIMSENDIKKFWMFVGKKFLWLIKFVIEIVCLLIWVDELIKIVFVMIKVMIVIILIIEN